MLSTRYTLPNVGGEPRARLSACRASICAILLGVALVFVAGFAQMGAIHNGAHDARHGAALPCH